jgi:hypothetical protein
LPPQIKTYELLAVCDYHRKNYEQALANIMEAYEVRRKVVKSEEWDMKNTDYVTNNISICGAFFR